jgi:SAM-dependent methyltransferase
MKLRAAIRRAPRALANAVRDLRYGGILGGTQRTRFAHLGAHDVGNADYEDLEVLFAAAGLRPEDVVVDVGCGKGRVLNWLLSRSPRSRVYGLELDPDVCAATARRLRRHRQVTVRCGDATELLPPDGTLFFLFNPFDETVMRRFAAALLALPEGPRRVVYHNCKFVDVFREDPRFEVEPIALRSFPAALIQVK